MIDTSERERVEPEATRNRALLADAVEALTDGFVIFDHEERLVLCNGRYHEIHRDSAEILEPGFQFEKVGRAMAERCLGLSDPAAIDDWVEERLERHRNPAGPFEQSFKAGRGFRISESRLPNGWTVGICTDISELKQRDVALRESEGRYRELFEESPIAMLEEDWRRVRRLLVDWQSQGVDDFARPFDENPQHLGKAYEVAEEAKQLNPDIKVLMMSGYAETALHEGGHGHFSRSIELLNKPFRKRELAQKLRDVLDKN